MIQEKSLDVGRRSARLIIAKLKEGHTYIAKNRKDRFGKRYFVYTNTNIQHQCLTSARLTFHSLQTTIAALLLLVTLMFGTRIGLTNQSLPQQYKYQEVYGQEFPEEEVSTPEDGSIVTENTAAPGVDVALEICGDYQYVTVLASKIMTSLGNKTKHTRPKAFVISVGATLVLTAMLSILIFTGNYGINAQTMGAHGGWNTTSGVKDHQQKMIIN